MKKKTKKSSSRKTSKNKKKLKKKVVMISGGFDPIHIGHIRYIREAKKLGDELIVVINNDNWLKKKKGKEFMSEEERKEIIEALSPVDKVIVSFHKENPEDMSVCEEIRKIKPDIFANGGDRKPGDIDLPPAEYEVCEELGIEMVFNVGKGGKVRSSSELLKEYSKNINK